MLIWHSCQIFTNPCIIVCTVPMTSSIISAKWILAHDNDFTRLSLHFLFGTYVARPWWAKRMMNRGKKLITRTQSITAQTVRGPRTCHSETDVHLFFTLHAYSHITSCLTRFDCNQPERAKITYKLTKLSFLRMLP